jgi:hypothetical protein
MQLVLQVIGCGNSVSMQRKQRDFENPLRRVGSGSRKGVSGLMLRPNVVPSGWVKRLSSTITKECPTLHAPGHIVDGWGLLRVTNLLHVVPKAIMSIRSVNIGILSAY